MTQTASPPRHRTTALVLLVGAVGLLAAGVCLFQALLLLGHGGSWGLDRATVLTVGVLVCGVLGVMGVVRLVRRRGWRLFALACAAGSLPLLAVLEAGVDPSSRSDVFYLVLSLPPPVALVLVLLPRLRSPEPHALPATRG